MKLTKKEIEQVADLARLSLSESEKEMYAEQLSVVLDYIGMLDEVNTDGVPETCQVTGLTGVIREDVVIETDAVTREKMLKNFPDKFGQYLRVKAVFGENEE